MFAFFRNHRRRSLAADPFPPEWEPIVERRFPALASLERFRVHLKVFAWDKDWVGVKGLEVTDEMKVVISGEAARLARNLELDVYDELRTIVIYPSHFRKAGEEEDVFLGQAFRWARWC